MYEIYYTFQITVDQSDNVTFHVTNQQEQLEKIWWHKVNIILVAS